MPIFLLVQEELISLRLQEYLQSQLFVLIKFMVVDGVVYNQDGTVQSFEEEELEKLRLQEYLQSQ